MPEVSQQILIHSFEVNTCYVPDTVQCPRDTEMNKPWLGLLKHSLSSGGDREINHLEQHGT